MVSNTFELPSHDEIKQHVIESLAAYWHTISDEISQLDILPAPACVAISLPLKLTEIRLPKWGESFGVNGIILVPIEIIKPFQSIDPLDLWRKIDWFTALFLMLECWHERHWEQKAGPIHSYSFRLENWDTRMWDHAWVNRIALFLSAWAANKHKLNVNTLVRQNNQILVTHDVDAVNKTYSITIKRSFFLLFNILKNIKSRNLLFAKDNLKEFFKIIFSKDDWNYISHVIQMEELNNIKGIFNFHFDKRRLNIKRWLFDPHYSISDEKLKTQISQLLQAGHKVGIHPGYDSWDNASLILDQRMELEREINNRIMACRQHWLRFSWGKTWQAQEQAGLSFDTTLMFNDRSGFRNAAAIIWKPWDTSQQKRHSIQACPTILMDSHLYDYFQFDTVERERYLSIWIEECKNVCGSAAVLWHPHTLSSDYGWKNGFELLLNKISEK